MFVAVVLAFGFAGCSNTATESDIDEITESKVEEQKNDPDLEKFIDEHGKEFVESFKTSFVQSSGGNECECTIYVDGTSVIIKVLLSGIDDVPAETKAQLQELYDAQNETLKTEFYAFKEASPNLTNVIFDVCEEDGDILAKIDLEF